MMTHELSVWNRSVRQFVCDAMCADGALVPTQHPVSVGVDGELPDPARWRTFQSVPKVTWRRAAKTLAHACILLQLALPAYAQRTNGVGVRVNGTTTSESVATLNTNLVTGLPIGDTTLTLRGNSITFQPLNNTTSVWAMQSSGHFIASTDNTYDIGASGNNRPRNLYIAGSIAALNTTIDATGVYATNGRSRWGSTADKLFQYYDANGTTGMETNVGTPTLGTCTGGTLVSGSHNFGGEVTGNTSASCVINFGTPNFTNTPFCVLNDETNLTAIKVSARSTSSITVTGAGVGDAFQYICFGRIGT